MEEVDATAGVKAAVEAAGLKLPRAGSQAGSRQNSRPVSRAGSVASSASIRSSRSSGSRSAAPMQMLTLNL